MTAIAITPGQFILVTIIVVALVVISYLTRNKTTKIRVFK